MKSNAISKKIGIIMICCAVLILILTVVMIQKAEIYRKNNVELKEKIADLELELSILNMHFTANKIELNDLKTENKKIKSENEQLKIDYAAESMFSDLLKGKYLELYNYAFTAEKILSENGISFKMISEISLLDDIEKQSKEYNEYMEE